VSWVDAKRLLGPGDWAVDDADWSASLATEAAADLSARLRKLVLGGASVHVDVRPSLKRRHVRAARTDEARRMRDTTPGFLRKGVRLDEQGRVSLTPEALSLRLGNQASNARVFDACCGCGGNAIGFARAGCKVIAAEVDASRLALARHNASLYGVADRIEFLHGDATELARAHSFDLLFVDPPWDVDGLHPLASLWALHGPCWAKLPPSFDVATLPGGRPSAWFGEAEGDQRRVKFLVVTKE
jgi:SAM-dependent methyltransferase